MGNSSIINILLYNGLALGSPLEPSFANIFMSALGQKFLV